MPRRPVVIGAVAVVLPALAVLGYMLVRGRQGAEGPLDRYASYARAHPEVAVRLTVRAAGTPMVGEGRFLRGADRTLFTLKVGTLADYACLMTPEGVLETEAVQKVYDEHASLGRLVPPPGRISSLAEPTFPFFLLGDDLRGLAPPGTAWKPEPRQDVGGKTVDVVSAAFGSNVGGSNTLRAFVDADGRLLRFQYVVVGGMANPRDLTWDLVHEPAPGAAAFALEVPAGYSPYALPDDGYPLQIGEVFPVPGWAEPATGAAVDLAGRFEGRSTLVALLGADSEPSRRALPSLERLRAKLPVVVLTDAATVDEARAAKLPGVLFDPKGTSLARLSAPATPIFFLVGTDGKVVKSWMGYDPKQGAAFEREVVAALSSP